MRGGLEATMSLYKHTMTVGLELKAGTSVEGGSAIFDGLAMSGLILKDLDGRSPRSCAPGATATAPVRVLKF